MSLENLSAIGRLKPHSATAEELERLLVSASTCVKESKLEHLSRATRLDLAYKALMQSALAALMANGYRPATSEPGHQQTTIQTLPLTIGLPVEKLKLFDGFRRARNLSDYSGIPVEERIALECIEAAERLLNDVQAWLKANRPRGRGQGSVRVSGM
jgi:hypothetical protein